VGNHKGIDSARVERVYAESATPILTPGARPSFGTSPNAEKAGSKKMKGLIEWGKVLLFNISGSFDSLKMVITSADIPPKMLERKTHIPLGAQPVQIHINVKCKCKQTTTAPCNYRKHKMPRTDGDTQSKEDVTQQHFPCSSA
jgi:hypothetical protein